MRYLLLAVPLILVGCGTLDKVEDIALAKLADGVDRYCERSEGGRAALRDRVAEETAPHRIIVECDAVDETPSQE